MGLLRTFLAVDIPPGIQKNIQHHVDGLRRSIGNSVRWAPVHNIHLTLKFLGDVSQENVDMLKEILQAEANSHPAFDITIGGLGSFPNSKRARVLFIGIQAPACPEPGRRAGLEALQCGIESACAGLGYESDAHPFSPHLTIGRIRDRLSASDRQKIRTTIEETKIDSLGTARVDSVHIYKSDLKPGGALYTKLFSASLKAT